MRNFWEAVVILSLGGVAAGAVVLLSALGVGGGTP